jgi:hypothetical protein
MYDLLSDLTISTLAISVAGSGLSSIASRRFAKASSTLGAAGAAGLLE